MGIIDCSVHGISGIALVCPHIEEQVNMRKAIANSTDIQIDIGDTGVDVTYTFCQRCVEEYHLPQTNSILPDTIVDDYALAFEPVKGVCGKCLGELLV